MYYCTNKYLFRICTHWKSLKLSATALLQVPMRLLCLEMFLKNCVEIAMFVHKAACHVPLFISCETMLLSQYILKHPSTL